jgi:nucleoside-diphosphate-sugar epimerase
MNVLILGVNGFIGHALTRRILKTTDWDVYGMDLSSSKLGESLRHKRFHFIEGDITIHHEWVEYHVKKCDVVLPLVAIATPAAYVRQPLEVFELDFEANLAIVRQCARYGKRVVFPSTSEVYGMCEDEAFDEDASPLVMGPIARSRWIYACSKQLLDRVIAAYGQQRGLRYTLFRPFNWIGPRLDDLNAAKEGSSRVVTQFIGDLVSGRPLVLVDGGEQRRCFTWLGDGVDALMRIIEDRDSVCDREIFNLGNPDNECSIRELAERLSAIYGTLMRRSARYRAPRLEAQDAAGHYGAGYQDIVRRRPSIAKARRLLHWEPRVGLDKALEQTFRAFLEEWSASEATAAREPATPRDAPPPGARGSRRAPAPPSRTHA